MAQAFSGKIIEAYFQNNTKDSIAVIYKEGDKAVEYTIKVSGEQGEDQNFKDLIAEYPLEKIEKTTKAKVEAEREGLRKIVEKFYGNQTLSKEEEEALAFKHMGDFLFNYDENKHSELLFRLKLKIFEIEKVKASEDADKKAEIRKATDPIKAIISYTQI